MRHILRVDFLADKVESDLRRRALIVAAVIADRANGLESESATAKLRAATKWMCRVTARLNHKALVNTEGVPLDVAIGNGFHAAAEALRHTNAEIFRRRAPFHHFCTSESESVFAFILSAASLVEEAAQTMMRVDPSLCEALYPPPVQLPERIVPPEPAALES